MSKLVQNQYGTNCYDSQTCLNLFRIRQYDVNCYNSQTCLNLFRFTKIWIVTIHMILKHVWTCSNKHVLTCSESIWYELLRFSNMSKLVQNQYDMNCYDSQTCLNLFRINIWYELLWFSNMSKLVQKQYDMNCYESQTCLNLSRINMIQIIMILKHV